MGKNWFQGFILMDSSKSLKFGTLWLYTVVHPAYYNLQMESQVWLRAITQRTLLWAPQRPSSSLFLWCFPWDLGLGPSHLPYLVWCHCNLFMCITWSCSIPSYTGVAIPPPLSLSSIPPRPVNFNPSKSGLSTFPHPRPFMGGKHKPSDTLIVKKIPRDMNTITKISSHFEKFGTIVNIKVSGVVGNYVALLKVDGII